jgi:hypothetical protein
MANISIGDVICLHGKRHHANGLDCDFHPVCSQTALPCLTTCVVSSWGNGISPSKARWSDYGHHLMCNGTMKLDNIFVVGEFLSVLLLA